jgi:hypothetical protein
MFRTYENFAARTQLSNLTLPSRTLSEIYFHPSLVSFISHAKKKEWLNRATDSLSLNPEKDQPPNGQNEMHPRTAIEEMRAASTYTEFNKDGERSRKKVWTALFLTWDNHWQYWGAVVWKDTINRIVHVYIQPFEILSGSKREICSYPQAAHKSLRGKCRSKGWRTTISVYNPDKCSLNVKVAFGWDKIWKDW